MKQITLKPAAQVSIAEALAATRTHDNQRVIGYTTKTGDHAFLVCLFSSGRSKKPLPGSLKPEGDMWGFIYPNNLVREASFVRATPEESITMCLNSTGRSGNLGIYESMADFLGITPEPVGETEEETVEEGPWEFIDVSGPINVDVRTSGIQGAGKGLFLKRLSLFLTSLGLDVDMSVRDHTLQASGKVKIKDSDLPRA